MGLAKFIQLLKEIYLYSHLLKEPDYSFIKGMLRYRRKESFDTLSIQDKNRVKHIRNLLYARLD